MAIVTFKLDDDVFARYAERNPEDPAQAIAEQAKRFVDYGPAERALILEPEVRRELEKLYQRPIENQSLWLKWIRKLHSVRVDEVEIPITAAQIGRLVGDAKFFRRDPKALLVERVGSLISAALGT